MLTQVLRNTRRLRVAIWIAVAHPGCARCRAEQSSSTPPPVPVNSNDSASSTGAIVRQADQENEVPGRAAGCADMGLRPGGIFPGGCPLSWSEALAAGLSYCAGDLSGYESIRKIEGCGATDAIIYNGPDNGTGCYYARNGTRELVGLASHGYRGAKHCWGEIPARLDRCMVTVVCGPE